MCHPTHSTPHWKRDRAQPRNSSNCWILYMYSKIMQCTSFAAVVVKLKKFIKMITCLGSLWRMNWIVTMSRKTPSYAVIVRDIVRISRETRTNDYKKTTARIVGTRYMLGAAHFLGTTGICADVGTLGLSSSAKSNAVSQRARDDILKKLLPHHGRQNACAVSEPIFFVAYVMYFIYSRSDIEQWRECLAVIISTTVRPLYMHIDRVSNITCSGLCTIMMRCRGAPVVRWGLVGRFVGGAP